MSTDFLVADDEPDIAESTKVLLEMYGYAAHTVSDASEILPALRRHVPKVLLQDMRMPGLDLPRLLGEARADPVLRGMRIVIFTANLNAAALARDLDADDVLEKPFDPSVLLERARAWIGPRERPAQG